MQGTALHRRGARAESAERPCTTKVRGLELARARNGLALQECAGSNLPDSCAEFALHHVSARVDPAQSQRKPVLGGIPKRPVMPETR